MYKHDQGWPEACLEGGNYLLCKRALNSSDYCK